MLNSNIFYRKTPFVFDSQNNNVTVRSIVKILGSSRALMGKLAEVKGLYKNNLFVWIKENLNQYQHLKESNGYLSIDAKRVVVAGHDLVKAAQPGDRKGLIVGQIDRKQKDKRFSRAYVVVMQGQHKGLKGRVFFADDNIVKLELMSTNEKVVLPRDHV